MSTRRSCLHHRSDEPDHIFGTHGPEIAEDRAVSTELVGRDSELEAAEVFAESLAAGPAALVIGGGAGMGKTAVWQAAADAAEELGIRVLRTRCAEVEMPIAFGHLSDLLGDVLHLVAADLPDRQRAALEVGLGLGGSAGVEPDSVAVARATLGVLVLLARAGPVLVAVDDLQWLDRGSTQALTFALRRVEGPIGLLATVRDESGIVDPLTLADAYGPDRFRRLQLGPLSSGALQRMLRIRLGAFVARPTLARIHAASGGNPMFALEFARLLDPAAGGTAPLAVPRSLEEVVHARIARLPAELVPALEIVSALERPSAQLVATVLGDPARGERLVDGAVAVEALARGPAGELRFTHPLLASAVYFGMPHSRRRELHTHLAAVVDSVEERGRHAALAAEHTDAETATVVAAAAASAAGRGALEAAAGLSLEAARVEPEPALRRERTLDAASYLVDVGEFAAARSLLDRVLDEDLDAREKGRVLLVRAESEIANRAMLVRYLEEALELAVDEPVRWQALIRLAQHGRWVSGDAEGAVRVAAEALESARRLGDVDLVAESEAALAFYEAAAGMRTTGPGETALLPPRTHRPWWSIGPGVSLGARLMWAGHLAAARSVLAAEHEQLARAGREARSGFVLVWRAELEWRAGCFDEATAFEREATDILGDLIVTAAPRLLLLATRGDAEDARSLGFDMLGWAETLVDRHHEAWAHWTLGLLELSRADATAAAPHVESALALLDAGGFGHPGPVPVLGDVIECRVAAGRVDEAATLAARLERAASQGPWARASALRANALVALARGDTESAGQSAAASAAAWDSIGAVFQRARALLVLGDACRRSGERRTAAASIVEAAAIFGRLGAGRWLERAETELLRANPRPTHDRDELTAAERRVAAVVAAGRTNKEVAAELFTTVATVEAHLTRIYRKLGIRSRTELVRRVAVGEIVLTADE